ncbi:MAG: hypothetical protein IH892_10555 [Planctomycetes bacterium]|nr:hypothetical protein [Planctomycetota bacterium]
MERFPGNDPEEIVVIGELVNLLDQLHIVYAIGGSLASSAYGAVRFTQDADIAIEPFSDKAEAFFSAVKDAFYISKEAMLEAIRLRQRFNIIHFETAFKIDLFVCRDTSYDKQVLVRRAPLELTHTQGTRFFFVSPEDIILLKLQWYKAGGETSQRQWADVLSVINVQADVLDKVYLEHEAGKLNLSNLLKKASTEAQG